MATDKTEKANENVKETVKPLTEKEAEKAVGGHHISQSDFDRWESRRVQNPNAPLGRV